MSESATGGVIELIESFRSEPERARLRFETVTELRDAFATMSTHATTPW